MVKTLSINFEDRISNLPRDVIQCIMEFLAVRDAARTCVLSKKWRFVWSDHPSLVLDMGFWKDIEPHKSPDMDYSDIVSSILLHHVGYILKFVVDLSLVTVSSKVDLWLSSLCRRGLKVFDLQNYDEINGYKVPSCVFLTSDLTHLSLSFCDIEKTVGCFTNIQSLILEDVNFDSFILTTPLLTSLTMQRCSCNFEFEISAPRLASLTLDCNDIINLKPLVELLALWPRISLLAVDGYCFKQLTTGSIPDNDILPLNLRSFVLRDTYLDSELIAWILYLLKNSPCLRTFEIWFGEDVMHDIDVPVDFTMDQLGTVMMKDFTATRNEVMFVKILLKCAPLLGKLLIEENDELDPSERMKILKELFLLQREYPKTEIIYAPNLVPD